MDVGTGNDSVTEVGKCGGGSASGGEETWNLDEKDQLFQFVSKVFQQNFPIYLAYKHCIHSSLEELSKQDAGALNNYCELNVSVCVGV